MRGRVYVALATFGVALSLVAASTAGAAQQIEAYEVVVPNAKALSYLASLGFDITETRRGSRVEIDASPEQAQALRKLGMAPKLRRDAQGLSSRQSDARIQQADGSYEVYRPYWDHTYVGTDANGDARPTLYEEMLNLAASHPNIAKPVVIGRSLNGVPILAVRVTKDAQDPQLTDGQRPATIFMAAQHAREWITPEMIRRLAHLFIDNYGGTGRAETTDGGGIVGLKKSYLTQLVNTRELWFIVVANPDGYDFTFTPGNRLWRKNLRDNNGDGQIDPAHDGVDPNRNYPSRWNYDNAGSSGDPSSETFRGTEAASEPETRAMDGFLRRVGFQMMVNYHSAAELLLYPLGWQSQTYTADDPLFRALSGTLRDSAVKGIEPGAPDDYVPEVGAFLYTTNGETTDHAYTKYGTLAWTPEMDVSDPDRGGGASVFEFQDSAADVEDAFEKNVPFALDIAESSAHPSNPTSHLGNTAPDFQLDTFDVSYGDPQTVEVDAKRDLGAITAHWAVEGNEEHTAPMSEWAGGERYGDEGDVYYHRVRGQITGTKPGDHVRVWFEGDGKTSKSFTYVVHSDTGNPVLILSAEDYSGNSALPAYASTSGPFFLNYYEAALDAAGVGHDVYDVDAMGREAPDALGVLSHYQAVVWYTGNDLIVREPGQGPGTGVSKLINDEILQVRDYLNDGGKLLYTGQNAATNTVDEGFVYNPAGQPPFCNDDLVADQCVPMDSDFLQYWLGAYVHLNATGDPFAGADLDAARALSFQLNGGQFGSTPFTLNGPDSAENQGHVYVMVPTSNLLPKSVYPQFASERAAALQGPSAFDPPDGSSYMVASSRDRNWQRLSKTVDLTGASSASLHFDLSYDTEPFWDFVFVEVHTVGQDNWTTLPDANGHTDTDPGDSCAEGWIELHPFIEHYQTFDPDEGCEATGSTGSWNAASGNSGGFGEWDVDLSAFAGDEVEIAISYVQDWATGGLGAFLDDVSITKDGAVADQTSFEADAGGWTAGAPDGSEHDAAWVRQGSVGFTEGPGVATADTLYYGFGLEGVTGAADRASLMTNAMHYLGVTTSGGSSGGGGGGGGGTGTQPPAGGGGSPPADVGGEAQSGAGGQQAIGGAKAPARVSFARQTLRVPKGRHYVRVKLACPVSAGTSTRCRGVLRMLLGGTLLARRAFSIPADTPATIRLQLRDRDYRRLLARGRMNVSGIVLTRGADGRQRRVAATLTLLPS